MREREVENAEVIGASLFQFHEARKILFLITAQAKDGCFFLIVARSPFFPLRSVHLTDIIGFRLRKQ